MIDTHSHIYGPEFAEDIHDVILRAKNVGVSKILLPNINVESVSQMLGLCDAYPGYCYPMMGLHPTDIEDDYQDVLDKMHGWLTQDTARYVAVGEVGLDFYWDDSRRTQQMDAFSTQIDWANQLHLPLMIHARSAQKELVEMMNLHKNDRLSGVFHCFGGTIEDAKELMDFEGFVFGIGGVVTYKKSTLPEALSQIIPLDRIVLETDSPYLAPVPFRGKRNESSYVAHVAQKVAEIYGVSVGEVIEITDRNTARIFPALAE